MLIGICLICQQAYVVREVSDKLEAVFEEDWKLDRKKI